MVAIRNLCARFFRDEDGATMAEYVFTVAFIALVMMNVSKFMGKTAANKMNTVSGNIANSK
jgi:Flp pilus assembly pilin Flp